MFLKYGKFDPIVENYVLEKELFLQEQNKFQGHCPKCPYLFELLTVSVFLEYTALVLCACHTWWQSLYICPAPCQRLARREVPPPARPEVPLLGKGPPPARPAAAGYLRKLAGQRLAEMDELCGEGGGCSHYSMSVCIDGARSFWQLILSRQLLFQFVGFLQDICSLSALTKSWPLSVVFFPFLSKQDCLLLTPSTDTRTHLREQSDGSLLVVQTQNTGFDKK